MYGFIGYAFGVKNGQNTRPTRSSEDQVKTMIAEILKRDDQPPARR